MSLNVLIMSVDCISLGFHRLPKTRCGGIGDSCGSGFNSTGSFIGCRTNGVNLFNYESNSDVFDLLTSSVYCDLLIFIVNVRLELSSI